jgi:SAM-dependent methyltransferase
MKTELLQQCNLCHSRVLEILDSECNITRCQDCGFIFDNPRPTLEELIAFYSQDKKYDSWLGELDARERIWKRRLRVLERYKKPGTLLDVGTGIGQFLDVARSSFTEVFGTEISTTAIQIAKERYGLTLFEGSIEDVAKQSRTFDNITLFHVLEHVPDPRAMLITCNALLVKGGMLVIAVPSEISSLRAFSKRALPKLVSKNRHKQGKLGLPLITLEPTTPEVHLSHFTPVVLDSLLRNVGFDIVKRTLDPYRLQGNWRRVKSELYYYCCLAFLRACQVNLYDTILVIARKRQAQRDDLSVGR